MAAQHKRPGVLAGDPACAPGAKQKLGTAGGQSDAARCPSGKAKARGLATRAVCPEWGGGPGRMDWGGTADHALAGKGVHRGLRSLWRVRAEAW